MKTKPLNKTQVKLIATIGALGFREPSTPETRTNPFSGVTCALSPLACKVYDFVTTQHLVCGRDYTRKDWDNARYLFCAQWPNEYMDLID